MVGNRDLVLRRRPFLRAGGGERETGFTRIPYRVHEQREAVRGQGDAGASAPRHNVRGAYTDDPRRRRPTTSWPSPQEVMDLAQPAHAPVAAGPAVAALLGHAQGRTCSSKRSTLRAQFSFENSGGTSTRSHRRHRAALAADRRATGGRRTSAACAGRKSATTRTSSSRATTSCRPARGSHNLAFGYDTFNDKRKGDNHQSGSDFQVWTTDTRHRERHGLPGDCRQRQHLHHLATRSAEASLGTNFRTHSLFFNDSWAAGKPLHVQPRAALGQEPRQGRERQPRGQRQRLQPAARRRRGIRRATASGACTRATASTSRHSPTPSPTRLRRRARRRSSRGSTRGRASTPRAARPLVASDAALRQVFDWFNAGGGTNRTPFFTSIPGRPDADP